VTVYEMDKWGLDSYKRQDFSLCRHIWTAVWPTLPFMQWISEDFSMGIKQLKHEGDHSLPSSTKI
jgi:hypothetical protein